MRCSVFHCGLVFRPLRSLRSQPHRQPRRLRGRLSRRTRLPSGPASAAGAPRLSPLSVLKCDEERGVAGLRWLRSAAVARLAGASAARQVCEQEKTKNLARRWSLLQPRRQWPHASPLWPCSKYGSAGGQGGAGRSRAGPRAVRLGELANRAMRRPIRPCAGPRHPQPRAPAGPGPAIRLKLLNFGRARPSGLRLAGSSLGSRQGGQAEQGSRQSQAWSIRGGVLSDRRK